MTLRLFRPVWLALALAACRSPGGHVETVTPRPDARGPRVLGIFAHPDDETTVAGTLYKTTTALDGVCDLALITNGEGGFRYSTLAEQIYGLELTDEEVGRAHLPRIRRGELLAGCALMGVRRVAFLDETDHRYTTDPLEVLGPQARVWDVAGVVERLRALLAEGTYDFVLSMAPSSSTHGHHQAATVLALRAVAALPDGERPVVLGVALETAEEGPPPRPSALEGFPETAVVERQAALVFDRTQTFGYRQRLDYRVLVNWVIAEHKSQGTMQLAMGLGLREHYFLFAANPEEAEERASAWFRALAGPQFEERRYGASAGADAEMAGPGTAGVGAEEAAR